MAHSYTNPVFHIVFGTKERRPLIDVDFQPRLYEYIGGTIRGLKATSLEIGGVEDHVHILAKLPPTIAVSDFLEKLKANTSKWSKSVRRGFGWQEGYSAFTVHAVARLRGGLAALSLISQGSQTRPDGYTLTRCRPLARACRPLAAFPRWFA